MEPLGLWLQLPMRVTEDKHKPADRVRLPRSLFTTLQGSRATVRLAISVLDIGSGNLFKVRRSWMEAQGSSEIQRSVYRAVLAFRGLPEKPDEDRGGDEPLDSVSEAAQGHPRPPSLESVNFRLILITDTQTFGPHTPVPSDLHVYLQGCQCPLRVPVHAHTCPFLFLVHVCSGASTST